MAEPVENSGKYGEPLGYDPDFKGPIEDRHCRDCLFLLIFLAYVGLVCYVAFWGITEGDPAIAFTPMDYYGNKCGKDMSDPDNQYGNYNKTVACTPDGEDASCPDLSAKSYLFWPLTYQFMVVVAESFCVEACPEPATFGDVDHDLKYGTLATVPLDMTTWALTYDSKSMFFRCMPKNMTLFMASFQEIAASSSMTNMSGDLQTGWVALAVGALAAVIFGFLWLFLLKLCAGLMVWVTIFAVMGIFIVATLYYYLQSKEMKEAAAGEETEDPDGNIVDSPAMASAKRAEYITYGLGAATLILLCVILFMMKAINLAITIVEEASDAMAAMPYLIFFPFFIFALVLIVIVLWMVGLAFVITAGEMVYSEGRRSFEFDGKEKAYVGAYLFAVLWFIFYIFGLSECTIAGSVATWYFASDKKKLGKHVVGKALGRILKYNAGSVAIGSFLIALIVAIRIILRYMSEKAKKSKNEAAKQILKCMEVYMACIDKIVRYISRNAYIMIAVYNYSFCGGAKTAFQLLMRNIRRVAAINMVSDFLLFLGKLFVAAATGVVASMFARYQDSMGLPLVEGWVFIGAIGLVIGFIIGCIFLSVYDMVIDTLFLAFLEDSERNDGSPARPYFCSDKLKRFIEDSGKK